MPNYNVPYYVTWSWIKSRAKR